MPERYLVILTARVVKDTIPEAYRQCSKCSTPYTWSEYKPTPRMPLRLMLAVTEEFAATRLCQHILCFACVMKNSDNLHEFVDNKALLWCCDAISPEALADARAPDGPAVGMFTNVLGADGRELDRRSEEDMRKTGKNYSVHPVYSEYSTVEEFQCHLLEMEWDLLIQDTRTSLPPDFTVEDVQKLVSGYRLPPSPSK